MQSDDSGDEFYASMGFACGDVGEIWSIVDLVLVSCDWELVYFLDCFLVGWFDFVYI